jgi:hypothetical protein
MEITKVVDGKRVLCEVSYSEWFKKEKPEFQDVWYKICEEFNPPKKLSKFFFNGSVHLGISLFNVKVRLRIHRNEHRVRLHGEVRPKDMDVHTAPFVHWCLEEPYSELMYVAFFKKYVSEFQDMMNLELLKK